MGLSEAYHSIINRLVRFRRRQASPPASLSHGLLQDVLDERSFAAEVMRNIDTAIAIFDADCRYLYVNPVAVKDPVRRESLIGRTDVEYALHWDKNTALAENRVLSMRRALRENVALDFEESISAPDGTQRYFIRKMRPVSGPDGRPYRLIGYGFDITDIKHAEQALRSSQEQLLRAQKMEAIGLLAGGIAHDFNNLLTVIGLHADMLPDPSADIEETRESVREIKKAVERAHSLTDQLLAFGRKQILRPRLLSLNAVVEDTESMMRRLVPERITVVMDLAGDLRLARVDPGQVAQVIMNLAVNARDAITHSGTLSISTRNTPESNRLPSSPCGAGDYVVLTISDTGSGMDEETRSHLFEPFFTTKGKVHGTGLGLATVYGIVTQTGGCIEVHSEIGKGSTFHICFPAADGTAEWPTAPESAAQGTLAGSGIVLLVEDEQPVRSIARKVLQRSGFTVFEAENGIDALEVYRHLGRPVDLVITDLVMPKMGGMELADELSQLQPGVKIVFMSGYTNQGDELRKRTNELGSRFIPKPFTMQSLQEKVSEALAE